MYFHNISYNLLNPKFYFTCVGIKEITNESNKIVTFALNKTEHAVHSYAAGKGCIYCNDETLSLQQCCGNATVFLESRSMP